MHLLFIEIILVSAAVGWCYTQKLTTVRGYLKFLPHYYPKFLQESLSCAWCVAGWCSIFTVIAFFQTFQYWTILNVLTAPCRAMALVGPIIHLNTFYSKIINNNQTNN